MAYNNKYKITFKDIANTTRTIYISEDGYRGSVTDLIPGRNVIEWDEDNSENLTSRVRGITGRIEVIEENYGDLDDLFPATPFQYRVVCQNVFWGYIKTQNSTNKWDAGPRSIKLNILSPLAMAYDVPMPINTTLGLRVMGDVMVDLMNALGYSYIAMPKGNSNLGDFFSGQIRGMYVCPYANDKDYHYANDDEIFAPISCGQLLEEICKRHDLMVHDVLEYQSAELLFTKYGSTGSTYRWTKTNIEQGDYGTATLIPNSQLDLLTAFDIAGTDNAESLVKPYSYIDILHDGVEGESVKMPTEQSDYDPDTDYYNLIPRGIWLTNKNGIVKLGSHEGIVDGESDNSDALLFNIYPNSATAGTLLFSINFHQLDKGAEYRLKLSYSHATDSGADGINISARGKGGWYTGNEVSGLYGTPTNHTETKILKGLSGDSSHITTPQTVYNVEYPLYMIADEYITINIYAGAISNLYIRNIELEKKPNKSQSRTVRWAEQRFVRRIMGDDGTRPLTVNMGLNETFFSNYYKTDYALLNEDPAYLLRSQRRLQVTVNGPTLDKAWYLNGYYLMDETSPYSWRIIAISYNVADFKYKITLHQINPV